MSDRSGRDDLTARVLRLHAEVDRKSESLAEHHAARLQCRLGCASCCVDEIRVFEVEAERIRRRHAELLATGQPRAAGACAFLDDQGACRIYEDRPYVCRTQGLPLRWLEDSEDGGVRELRDICPLNEVQQQPIEGLAQDECWSIGEFEGRLATLQVEAGGSPPQRIRLRDLFRKDLDR